MGLHFWLLEDLGGKAASCSDASSIKLLQVLLPILLLTWTAHSRVSA